MRDKRVFLASFIVLGFVMKIVAEFVHEVCGHGFFVLLFGGEITSVYISVLWPYELSYIGWPPSGFTSIQMAWIYGAGILVCLCLSFLIQAVLFIKKKITRYYALALFWLAFWTFISSTGYLIIGGVTPFGDVYWLIEELGVLTKFFSLILGLSTFVIGFVALSWILRVILVREFPIKKASLGVTLFWLIIPVLGAVMLASPERNFQAAYVPLMFIPSLLSFIVEYFLVLSKQEAYADPDNIAEE